MPAFEETLRWPEFWCVLAGLATGWVLRSRLQRWIMRHAVSQSTKDAIDRDIDAAVARWFKRRDGPGMVHYAKHDPPTVAPPPAHTSD
jgi:hypothetical protein